MSDENDAASGEPSETPTTPAPGAEGAESPTDAQPAPTPPAADEPVTVADPPAEAPTEVAPPAAASAGAAAAAPAAPPATAESSGAKGRGVFIPAWVAVVVGVLLIAGLGFAIGWIAAPNDDSAPSSAVATSPSQNGNSNGNGSNGNGNGQNIPSSPGNGNGSSSDDSSGDSSGDSTTAPQLRGAYLGVSVESAANNGGATITSVAEDSPAAAAGLKEGDVVTAVDGTQVTSALDLVRQIREHDINDSITVTYTRNGNTADAKVTLDSRPASQSVG